MEIENLHSQRISNLFFSLDKILHFLSKQDKNTRNQLPLRICSPSEQCEYIDSIIDTLKLEFPKVAEVIPPTSDLSDVFFLKSQEMRNLVQKKFALLTISNFLNASHESRPLADIIYLMAFNVLCFRPAAYKGFEMQINVRECDLTNPVKTLQRTELSTEQILENMEKPITVETK